MSVRTCHNCGHALEDDARFCAVCGAPADARPQPFPGSEDRARRQAAGPSGFVRAARRFWWVLALGLVLALFAAVSSFYHVSFFPPALESREVVTYSSSTRLLVTSGENPHLRYQVTLFGELTASQEGEEEEGAGRNRGEPPVIGVSPPDFNVLIRAANLFPLLIESDRVADYRRQEFGEIAGTVTAQGIYAFSTANRFELSEVPVIQLVSTGPDPRSAVDMADKTAKAFIGWIESEQAADEIPARDRIVVQQLDSPQAAASASSASKAMPVLVLMAVIGAFFVLAVVLDRLIPARSALQRAELEPVERRVKVKKSA